MTIIVFSDFDGTISKEDVLDKLIINKYGKLTQKDAEYKLLENKITFENYLYNYFDKDGVLGNLLSEKELELVTCDKSLIDEHFEKFYSSCVSRGIKFYITSSGFYSIIRSMLPFVTPSKIFANDLIDNKVVFHNHNIKSINKREIIQRCKHLYSLNGSSEENKIIYIGDGLSDFGVIDIVDILYVKRNSILHNHLIKINFEKQYKLFNSFEDILI
jgi:HAD superfamily phosphoserine phosphatase-like hydrolase